MAQKKSYHLRKSPVQARSIVTVDAILEAAAQILTTRGWAEFNTNEVARRAGVNIGTLYQYFPNKEAIVAELQRRHVAEIDGLWPEAPPGLGLAPCLQAAVEAVVAEHRVSPGLHRVFAEELPPDLRMSGALRPAEQRWVERLAPLVRVPDAQLAAFVCRVAVHAVIHEAASRRPELLASPLLVPELTRMLDAYLSGLGGGGGAPSAPPAAAP